MKIGTKVKLRDDGPIYGINDIEIEHVINFDDDVTLKSGGFSINAVKVDNAWMSMKGFVDMYKIVE
jgi:hypothetical protein